MGYWPWLLGTGSLGDSAWSLSDWIWFACNKMSSCHIKHYFVRMLAMKAWYSLIFYKFIINFSVIIQLCIVPSYNWKQLGDTGSQILWVHWVCYLSMTSNPVFCILSCRHSGFECGGVFFQGRTSFKGRKQEGINTARQIQSGDCSSKWK